MPFVSKNGIIYLFLAKINPAIIIGAMTEKPDPQIPPLGGGGAGGSSIAHNEGALATVSQGC